MSPNVANAALKLASQAFQGTNASRDTIKERLDPVALLATVALMRFQKSDSKIHIGDHQVTISHSSDFTYGLNFRSISRTWSGDSHDDLALIRSAIKTVSFWHSLHDEEHTEIREFMDHVSNGIDALMETYQVKHPITCDALCLYKREISDYKVNAPDDVMELNEVTCQIKELWDQIQFAELNRELRAMDKKQGTTPISTKILCLDEVRTYLIKLQAKATTLKNIFEDN